MKVYPFFRKKIKNFPKDHQFRVIISFEDPSNRDRFIEKNKDLNILDKFHLIPSIVLNLDKKQIINYEKEDSILNIEEDQKLFLSMLDVIEILELDDYKNSQIVYTGKNVTIGIIDDGIMKDIPSITKNIRKERASKDLYKIDDLSHGTIMASIIKNQFKDIDDNYIGIAPNVDIIDFKVLNLNQDYYFSDVLRIFDRIGKEKIKVDILLISLTSKSPSDGKDILSLACNLINDKGIIVVCPAGNFGPNQQTIGSPGATDKVFTIGSLTKELNICNFSGRGPTLDGRVKPDLCLYGSNVIVPLYHNLRVRVSGSSVSASIFVGLIVLLKEFDPTLTYYEINELLKKSCIDLGYEPNVQGLGTLKVTDLFKKLDLFHKKIYSYNYLIKKSLKFSIGVFIILIILFYFVYFFRIS